MPNVFSPIWDTDTADSVFKLRLARIGEAAGCSDLSATLWEIQPHGLLGPLPSRYGREELLVILAGTGSLVRPDGAEEVKAGDVVTVDAWFGSSRLENHGAEPLRLLQIGVPPEH